MLRLDPAKNDTSVTLDFLRAAAAQAVCIGHACNFGGFGVTFIPVDGVLVFFVLSGFLIAYTLDGKSRALSYTVIDFGVERFARIYTAYLPAMLFIGIATLVLRWYGVEMSGDPVNVKTFIGNLLMQQNVPCCMGVATFGTAGQLTSVALEFHIYFFVGAMYFVLRGRNFVLCCCIAAPFSFMPLTYFSSGPAGSDRALFALWLMAFASYYVAKAVIELKPNVAFWCLALVVTTASWLIQRTPGDDASLQQYPLLVLSFFSLVLVSQHFRVVPHSLSKLITFLADYSYSLFLVHLTIMRAIFSLWLEPSVLRLLFAILVSNVVAFIFAVLFERHYHRVADIIKAAIGRPSRGRLEAAHNAFLRAR
ncbi:acyltransferase family protein [Bradyrhizobium iriomotense]|uniref:acyltransferase family protein n=1 Tax=Bradyrhizobium iriomotense TaxID=441950 RepID=UPI001B8A7D05|nr:acyltransferase [Bradyrhizobium iriomotense]MBR0780542.1 acyltransferase [Bradyrhizobium iriomotense]